MTFQGSKALSEKVLMRGNEAVGEGAIRAGCRYFFGYPITPQNELFEYMAKRMPEVGGVFLQSESELAGINMLFGAAAGGARCMTSSSGPGFTLMGEGLTTLAAAQLPAVIVSVTRAGPGLGRIASAQSDYRLATRGGGHGDYQCLVLGPSSAQDLYELTYRGFELADTYRNPVIVLSDAILGQMMEAVDLERLPLTEPPQKEWAVRGKGDSPRKVIKAAPHTDEELIEWNRRLGEKYERCKEREQRYEFLWTDDASVVLVAFGSTYRIALDAVTRARGERIPVGMLRPISLWPFPEAAFKELLPRVERFLVVEANNGQMVDDVRLAVCGKAEVIHYGVGGGHIFSPNEIYGEIVRAHGMK
ncbi:MAG: 3-methyl-2-oxobutanoate dehydrogenase subunit VorB [Proteobacteria bacterium]|nr:3-methyl-2-oxobutanoate dehydrogenase subunit VorB [Pseudomonadota bacterium]